MMRLIDVALIILLGFISISRLKTEYVDLPSPGNPQPPARTVQEAKIVIHQDSFLLQENGRDARLQTVKALESAMVDADRRSAQRGQKLMFIIESAKGGMMQSLIDVLDICQRNKIEKSFDYEKFD